MTEEEREPKSESTEQAPAEEKPSEVERLRSEVEALRQQMEGLSARSEERLQNWQRAQADLINYRRRAEQERAEQTKFRNERLIARILPVLDDFERAFAALPRDLYAFTWIDGVNLIAAKLMAILQQEGVRPIEALGQTFDPTKHEAIVVEGVSDPYSGSVVAELQRGYTLHERLLRPTLVKVGPAEAPPRADEGSTTQPDASAGNDSADQSAQEA